jgi:hypothetical protein
VRVPCGITWALGCERNRSTNGARRIVTCMVEHESVRVPSARGVLWGVGSTRVFAAGV